jgi:probable phosphoglycerate mutase
MTTIALVRHGQTDVNLQHRWQGSNDAPLNARGRSQAQYAADTLSNNAWTRIITSPLQRARQTAAIVAHTLSLPPPAEDPGLVEQHGGIAEGMVESEIRNRWPSEADIPGVEPRTHVRRRGAKALRDLAAHYQYESFIVVAHGTLIRLAAAELTGAQTLPLLPNGHFLLLSTTSGNWTAVTTPNTMQRKTPGPNSLS